MASQHSRALQCASLYREAFLDLAQLDLQPDDIRERDDLLEQLRRPKSPVSFLDFWNLPGRRVQTAFGPARIVHTLKL